MRRTPQHDWDWAEVPEPKQKEKVELTDDLLRELHDAIIGVYGPHGFDVSLAKGPDLDNIASNMGVQRFEGETDEEFRRSILDGLKAGLTPGGLRGRRNIAKAFHVKPGKGAVNLKSALKHIK